MRFVLRKLLARLPTVPRYDVSSFEQATSSDISWETAATAADSRSCLSSSISALGLLPTPRRQGGAVTTYKTALFDSDLRCGANVHFLGQTPDHATSTSFSTGIDADRKWASIFVWLAAPSAKSKMSKLKSSHFQSHKVGLLVEIEIHPEFQFQKWWISIP